MNERKKGTVRSFSSCNADYLKLIINDLKLDADVDMLKYLQSVYAAEKRDPKVADLYFDAAALRSSCSLPDAELCSSVESSYPAVKELFSRLATRASDISISGGHGFPLCNLASFAAGSSDTSGGGSYFLSPAGKPEFPDNLSRGSCYFKAGDSLLYYSPAEKRSPSGSADSLMLIYPGKDMTCEEYWKTAEAYVLSLLDSDPAASLVSCTGKGIFYDIISVFRKVCIYPGELPGSKGFAESLFDSFAPGILVLTESGKTAAAVAGAREQGLFASVPAMREESQDSVRIFTSGESVVFPLSHINSIKLRRAHRMKAGNSGLTGLGKLRVSSPMDCDISAWELNGDAYTALSASLAGCHAACISGILNPSDPAVISFILALDSYVRNTGCRLAACRFTCGTATSITVWSLEGSGSVQRLERCGLPEFELSAYVSDGHTCTEVRNPEVQSAEVQSADTKAHLNTALTCGKVVSSLAELAGNTPMLKIYPETGANIFAKLEMFNPAGSAKDRVALSMLQAAAAAGELKPGGTVIEATSGNTGIGLACYGTAMGYKVVIIMPDTMSAERIQLIKAYGAQVILTPGAGGMAASNELAAKMNAENPDAFVASQFSNPANPEAHLKTTGPEIWRDLGGKVDFLVAGIGTGGTLCGSAAYLKMMNPEIKIIGCEPASSPLISKGFAGPHKIQGIGANFIPENYKAELVDGIIAVENEAAIAETQQLARKYGLLAGISSGCAVWAAKKIASLPVNAGKNIAVILPDTGEHYLSTGIFG